VICEVARRKTWLKGRVSREMDRPGFERGGGGLVDGWSVEMLSRRSSEGRARLKGALVEWRGSGRSRGGGEANEENKEKRAQTDRRRSPIQQQQVERKATIESSDGQDPQLMTEAIYRHSQSQGGGETEVNVVRRGTMSSSSPVFCSLCRTSSASCLMPS
jgi:hypothetical protein